MDFNNILNKEENFNIDDLINCLIVDAKKSIAPRVETVKGVRCIYNYPCNKLEWTKNVLNKSYIKYICGYRNYNFSIIFRSKDKNIYFIISENERVIVDNCYSKDHDLYPNLLNLVELVDKGIEQRFERTISELIKKLKEN